MNMCALYSYNISPTSGSVQINGPTLVRANTSTYIIYEYINSFEYTHDEYIYIHIDIFLMSLWKECIYISLNCCQLLFVSNEYVDSVLEMKRNTNK